MITNTLTEASGPKIEETVSFHLSRISTFQPAVPLGAAYPLVMQSITWAPRLDEENHKVIRFFCVTLFIFPPTFPRASGSSTPEKQGRRRKSKGQGTRS